MDGEAVACSQHPSAIARARCTACDRALCTGCIELALEGDDEHCRFCHAVTRKLPRTGTTLPPPSATRPPPSSSRPPPSSSRPPPSSTRPPPRGTVPPAAVVVGGSAALPDPSPLHRVVSYVFARDTVLVLLGLAVITAGLRWMAAHGYGPGGRVAWVMAAGLEASYFFHMLVDSAGGGTHLDPPEFASFYEDMLEPLTRYVLTLAPLVAAVIWYGVALARDWTAGFAAFADRPHSIFAYPGPAALLVASLALWPLMAAIAALGRSVIAAYNPIAWVQTLRLFGARYVAGAVVFYALLAAEAYVVPSLGGLRAVPIVGAVAIQMVAVIAMALRACVLGAVCEPYFR